MFSSVIFISLISVFPANVQYAIDNDPWCQRMEQVRNVKPNGMIDGVKDLRWEIKERYDDGILKSHLTLDRNGKSQLNYSEQGRVDNRIYTLVKYWLPNSEVMSGIERFFYDENGRLSHTEDRSLDGQLMREQKYIRNELGQWTKMQYLMHHADGTTHLNERVYVREGDELTVTARSGITNDGVTVNQIKSMDIAKYKKHNSGIRNFSWEIFLPANYPDPGELKRVYYEEYAYNDDPNAPYYEEVTATATDLHYPHKPPQITVKYYAERSRLISIFNKDSNGSLQPQERYEYSEVLDDNSKAIHSESLKFVTKDGNENLESKALTDFRYGPKGIELIEVNVRDAVDVLKENSQYLFTYCN